jgi:sugar O-acyltransferase (sialic acid O-acetyltransferase NeuD family)
MAKVIIFGAGKSAQMIRVYIERESTDEVVGFTVDPQFARAERFDGLPLVSWDVVEQRFPPDDYKLLGPLSYARVNRLRQERHKEAKARGYRLASFIHPSSQIYAEHIGEGCVILEQTVVQPYARIGDGVIVWCNCSVAHHTVIGDYCFLSGQVGIAGGTKLGPRCYLGGQTSIAHNLEIGEGSVLLNSGMLMHSVAPNSVVRGARAKVSNVPSTRLRRLL